MSNPSAIALPALSYTSEQVAPIMKRLLAHINTMNEQQLLAHIVDAKDAVRRAFSFTIENKYMLVVFGYGIVLYRDGQEIHSSKTTITTLSAILRNSARR